MDKKLCTKCGEVKDTSLFMKDGKYSDGSIRLRPECASCFRKRRKSLRRQKIIESRP